MEEVTETLIRALLKEQHPDLAELDIHSPVRGWDNELWRLGQNLAARLPRTERAPELLRKEHRWLPALAPTLPLPVPTPVHLVEPTPRFPQPWTIAAWVPGSPADRTPISEGDHAAEALAEFLRALHKEAPEDAPRVQERGAPLPTLSHVFEQQLRDLAHEIGTQAPALRTVWEDAVTAPPWQGTPVWLHSDLHPANVVVTDGTLSGVIDFGELCAGDPATDLAAAWLLLPNGAAPRFFEAYERADDATIRRARGRAVLQALVLIAIRRNGERGLPGGKVTWGRAGRATLQRLIAR
ncbi:aminoglycoside phosphotransferase family protein [Streptomyces sp. NPDC018029]|uniref:aminoglycoside phosphotransferase family protein n=1 Tax=Streptomyces sp. NPDC018029 TaxID=3365032 RepID=UPI0037959B0F